MKTLFICLTDYQLLNALNIKIHLLKDKQADILFFDNKEGNQQLAERLRKLAIFDNVYLHQYENINGLHKYFRNKTESTKTIGCFKAFLNSVKEARYKVGSKLLGKKFKINNKLYFNKCIDFKIYDQVFGIITKDLVEDVMELILKENPQAEINFIEDGTSTYWRNSITKDIPVKNIWIYQPELANYYSETMGEKLKQLPAIDWQDNEFRNIINEIFNFENKGEDYNNKVVFFEQNWDPMPDYLKNLSGMKKIILNNSYRKHQKESRLYDKKIELFRILADSISDKKEIIVKLHPRSGDSFAADYLQSKCKMAANVRVPWEVFEENYTFNNNIWVTVSSTALCSLLMSFKNKTDDVKLIFLYKMVYSGDDYQEDNEFFERLQKKYPGNVYIPETVEEYTKLLKNND